MSSGTRHIALQFGHIKHFNEGLAEFSRQLALQFSQQASTLKAERNWQFHFIMPSQWHGMFGSEVQYHDLHDGMRLRHRFPVDLDVWHGLHQHMRYRPPVNSRRNVITVHDLNHVYAKKGLSLWWQNMRLTRHLRRAHQLVAISQYAANDLRQHLPWAPEATVIHNGAADLSTAPQTPVEALNGQAFLLHISRMSPSKNVEALINMAAIWPERQLALVGPDSPEVQAHQARAKALGLNNVRFFTDVNESQKTWLYAHCDAFLFPSLMEGFGLPPIEAMFFGKPVVVARRTCLPEICGEGAAYWDDFEPKGMRQITESWLAQHQQNPGTAELVRQQAQRYTWARAAQQYMALYAPDAARKDGSTC
ncbi:glycosyltransferase family 1 protein [Aquabacterium sp.]|uniref:glycosyltransferase family 4 protein n=1 Tax=Aquabacterium sp. TaxID=1872578 RepID=UPI0025C2EA4B|nr:glycosyltransferase family 1 protein [Aquabacterium sp.]